MIEVPLAYDELSLGELEKAGLIDRPKNGKYIYITPTRAATALTLLELHATVGDALADDLGSKLPSHYKLSDMFEKDARVRYEYDYGDGWDHKIKLLETIDNYTDIFPLCTAGVGDAPPEDAGGPAGFRDFLAILVDKNHPEHDDTLLWAQDQAWNFFDIDEVNEALMALVPLGAFEA